MMRQIANVAHTSVTLCNWHTWLSILFIHILGNNFIEACQSISYIGSVVMLEFTSALALAMNFSLDPQTYAFKDSSATSVQAQIQWSD